VIRDKAIRRIVDNKMRIVLATQVLCFTFPPVSLIPAYHNNGV
jgi:hypothetical protein